MTLTDRVAEADAVLLMGVPDDAPDAAFAAILDTARARSTPVLYTNPDRTSPRAAGVTVASPRALAHAHAAAGGTFAFSGKPDLPVFRAVEMAFGAVPGRILMVGDSLEHDIAGAKSSGWDAAFVRGGLHAAAFGGAKPPEVMVIRLATNDGTGLPAFTLANLR